MTKPTAGELAVLRNEIRAVLNYTDLSIGEFLSGHLQPRDLFAAQRTLHFKALELMQVLDKLVPYAAETSACKHNYQPESRTWDVCTVCGDRQ